jgi:hypothetical protein
MPGFDTGLQHRVKRLAHQIADQHRQLSVLRGEVETAFDRGAGREAAVALGRFEAALAAHFELEQSLLFPALHGLSPGDAGELEVLEREHAGWLAALRGLASAVEGAGASGSRAGFASLLDGLRDHEAREERIVARISESE